MCMYETMLFDYLCVFISAKQLVSATRFDVGVKRSTFSNSKHYWNGIGKSEA